MAALIGMIIVSFVMIGARYFNVAVLSAFSDTVSLVLGYVGVVVFSIFTAIDVNRIKNNVTEVALMEDESILDRIEITGALNLYLDFINLFYPYCASLVISDNKEIVWTIENGKPL